MNLKSEIKEVDRLFQEFLTKASPHLSGKNKKNVLKHLNNKLKVLSGGKAKKFVKRVEKDFGVSLAEQYEVIERAERAAWSNKIT